LELPSLLHGVMNPIVGARLSRGLRAEDASRLSMVSISKFQFQFQEWKRSSDINLLVRAAGAVSKTPTWKLIDGESPMQPSAIFSLILSSSF
jgi:hypothetical protein